MSKDLSSAMSNLYIAVNLQDIRKEMQCPICLGIIRKTRTVMECLHRFCRECIDKSMRLGNNECPACRTHCASRRSLRDDPNFDALIAAIYPDIDKYEEEENALLEEEYRKNQQIQASIADTLRRQTEAVARRRSSTTKATAAAIVRKAHGFRGVQTSRSRGRGRGRGRGRASYLNHSSYDDEDDDDDDEDEEDRDEDDGEDEEEDDDEDKEEGHQGETTSTEETNRNLGKKRRRPRISLSTDNSEEEIGAAQKQVAYDNDEDMLTREETDPEQADGDQGATLKSDVTWPVAGTRSQPRHGNGTTDQNQSHHLDTGPLSQALVASFAKETSELHVYINLRPLKNEFSEESLPDLERPHLSCPARMTVHQLLEIGVVHAMFALLAGMNTMHHIRIGYLEESSMDEKHGDLIVLAYSCDNQILELRLSPRPKGELEVVLEKARHSRESYGSKAAQHLPRGKMATADNAQDGRDYEVLNPTISLKKIFSESSGSSSSLILLYRLKTRIRQ